MIDGDLVDSGHQQYIKCAEGIAKGKMVDNQIGNGFIGKQNAKKQGCENAKCKDVKMQKCKNAKR